MPTAPPPLSEIAQPGLLPCPLVVNETVIALRPWALAVPAVSAGGAFGGAGAPGPRPGAGGVIGRPPTPTPPAWGEPPTSSQRARHGVRVTAPGTRVPRGPR